MEIAEPVATYGLSEREFTPALARHLTWLPTAGAGEPTARQESLLAEHGGIIASTPAQ